MRVIGLCAAIGLLAVGLSAGPAAASPGGGGSATLTLLAADFSGPITDPGFVLTASGPITISGPPGTSAAVPPGVYALQGTPPPDSPSDGGGWLPVEIVCSNAPSGVREVEVETGEDVVCTFQFVQHVPSQPPEPPAIQPPDPPPTQSELKQSLPDTGPEALVPGTLGLVLVATGASLVLLARPRRLRR